MFILFLLLIIFDRLLKIFAINNILNNIGIKNILFFEFYKNYNLALGISLNNLLIIIFAIILFIFLIYFFYNKDKKIAFCFISIGFISNIFDRIFYGYVIDYINILNINIFNISDILIIIGMAILLINIIKNDKQNKINSNR